MQVTLKQIADRAGVSVMAVSAVMNHTTSTRVSQKKREYIAKIANELGYIPNCLSRSLVSNVSKLIGVFLESTVVSTATSMIFPIDKIARKKGYSTFISSGGPNDSNTIEALQRLQSYRIDGLIYHSTTRRSPELVDFLNSLKIPIVFIDRPLIEDHPALIRLNYQKALDEMADFLAARKHKSAQLLLDEFFMQKTERLQEPYRKALGRVGIKMKISENWQYPCGESFEQPAYEAVMRNLQKGDVPSLLLVFNDLAAIGAIAAIQDFGLRVPEDISVVGRDGISFTRYMRPALTTIARPDSKVISQTAFDMLLSMMKDSAYIPEPVSLDMHFSPGQTVTDFI
jgi:DNA-binding LacI/PurR family transcriptional regulator